MRRSLVSQTFLFLFMLVVGVLIVAQLRTFGRTRVLLANPDDQAVLLSELVDANHSLRLEIAALEAQLASYDQDTRGTVLEDLVSELNRIKVVNGSIGVSGPGVELLVDGPVSVLDLQDIVNELRNAGAEAITLNNRRLVAQSVLLLDGDGALLVDGQRVSRPYRFQSVGDPDTIETALLRPGGIVALLQHAYPGIVVQSAQQSRIVLPVYRSYVDFQYAQAVE